MSHLTPQDALRNGLRFSRDLAAAFLKSVHDINSSVTTFFSLYNLDLERA